jgi:hypothetical protein
MVVRSVRYEVADWRFSKQVLIGNISVYIIV